MCLDPMGAWRVPVPRGCLGSRSEWKERGSRVSRSLWSEGRMATISAPAFLAREMEKGGQLPGSACQPFHHGATQLGDWRAWTGIPRPRECDVGQAGGPVFPRIPIPRG